MICTYPLAHSLGFCSPHGGSVALLSAGLITRSLRFLLRLDEAMAAVRFTLLAVGSIIRS